MGIHIRKTANATWAGDVAGGVGHIRTGSGAIDGPYSVRSREDSDGAIHTSPEELIGAGLAGCFAMSLASVLADAGHAPAVNVTATVHLEQAETGMSITKIDLDARGDVGGLSQEGFERLAREAEGCPVTRALAGTEIVLVARLDQVPS